MGQTGRTIALVILGLAAALMLAPTALGAHRSDPRAHIACAPTGCTETSTDNLPGGGLGATETDQIPSNANQGSIQAAPTCATAGDGARAESPLSAGPLSGPWAHAACDGDQVKAFTQLIDTVVTELGPNTNVTKKQNQRVVACAFLSLIAVDYSWESQPNSSYDSVKVTGGVDQQAAILQVCLQLVALISATENSAAPDAGTASAGCSQQQATVTVAISRVRGRYSATVKARPRTTARRMPIAVSCRRSGAGIKLAITPRRHRTFRQVGAASLGIAYVNRSKTPLPIKTTFKVN